MKENARSVPEACCSAGRGIYTMFVMCVLGVAVAGASLHPYRCTAAALSHLRHGIAASGPLTASRQLLQPPAQGPTMRERHTLASAVRVNASSEHVLATPGVRPLPCMLIACSFPTPSGRRSTVLRLSGGDVVAAGMRVDSFCVGIRVA